MMPTHDREAHVVVEHPQEPERADQAERHRQHHDADAEPAPVADVEQQHDEHERDRDDDRAGARLAFSRYSNWPDQTTRVARRQRHLLGDDALAPRRRSRRGRGPAMSTKTHAVRCAFSLRIIGGPGLIADRRELAERDLRAGRRRRRAPARSAGMSSRSSRA